mmetsp:Transcript_4385/g.6695  ORF Transcript_4385/g.6695 Transcript_4385/m.6695 type:complete len:157 (+) Transcript_4385:38-508(+)
MKERSGVEARPDLMHGSAQRNQSTMSPLEKAVHQTQEELIRHQKATASTADALDISDEQGGTSADIRIEKTADDALESFYERQWALKQFPPLPTADWALLFPNLRLDNDSTGYSTEGCDVPETDQIKMSQFRSQLKARLKKDMLAEMLLLRHSEDK